MTLNGAYRQPRPEPTAFYRCLEDDWPEFRESDPYFDEKGHGPWRAVAENRVERFRECDLCHGFGPTVCDSAALYRPRHPEESVLYGVVTGQLETFLDGQRQRERTVPRFVERELRSFLDAESWHTVSCAFTARTADGIVSWLFPATVVFALPAAAAGWPTRRRSEPNTAFDGKTFEGWEGDIGGMFRIERGAIVAGSLSREIARNEFLCTRRESGDFELRLKFKLLGDQTNAGVQFRTRRIPNHHEVIGYQADLGNPRWWGSLYDESRRDFPP